MKRSLIENWLISETDHNDWHLSPDYYLPLPEKKERKNHEQINYIFKAQVKTEEVHQISNSDILSRDLVDFYIHPFNIDRFKKYRSLQLIEKINVKRTSSFRTFFLDQFFIKTSLQKENKNHTIDKPLYSYQIERAVLISRYLKQIPKESNFQFLSEDYGVYFNCEHSPYGHLKRELPGNLDFNKEIPIPYFSLFYKKDDGSILEKNLKGLSFNERVSFIEAFLKTLIHSFLDIYWEYGVCLEMHQQNLLLLIDQNEKLSFKFLYRDLDGARVDFEKVRELNKDFSHEGALQPIEYNFETNKIKQLKEKMPSKDPSVWNGLTFFHFRAFIDNSLLYLLDYHYKIIFKDGFSPKEKGIEILNQLLYQKNPKLF